MTAIALVGHAPAAIDLNQPGSYLNWNIFTISVANLVLIGVMVVIFGVALLLPFPGRHRPYLPPEEVAEPEQTPGYNAEPGDERMWTARARRWAIRLLPPGKLLPDRQPAYVASWVYIFGVASLAALGVVLASGGALALGGPDWWHTNPVGHFFNSLHMWSVELFMAMLVIHLWGKFWMAAWRGRRAATWITGVVAFVASVLVCFTGYLSQQNFDSQWIATNGKDAFNAVGIGAFFNLMNFGQMLMWHIVILPIVLVALIGAHVLMVRHRGVSHPLPATRPTWRERRADRAADRASWRGPTKRYDILKEGTIAVVIALALTFALAGLLSSPDLPAVSVRSWVQVDPGGFLATAASELNGTSGTATLGPPYNTNGTPQSEGFAPSNWTGLRQPIDTAQDFVLGPLTTLAPTNPALAAALETYHAASADQQNKWVTNYFNAAPKVKFVNGVPVLPAGRLRPGSGHAGHRTHPGSQRRDRHRPPRPAPVLRHRLHQAVAVPRRRRLLQQPGGRPEPDRRPVGRDERDRQLPWPALAVAVPDVVPRARLEQLRQHRPHRHLHDRPGHPAAAVHPVHPGPA